MLTITNYKITKQIYESTNSLVFRGIRDDDNQAVIIKILKEDYPTHEELTRYRQEYDITHNLANLDGVINAYSLEKYQNTLMICLEDFGGESLKTWMDNDRSFTFDELLTLAIRTTGILGQIHQKNIIHKNINPSNIVWNPDNGALKIIDFGISTQLSTQDLTLKNPEVLEGTLAYMSPEQTGRMNRALDYRTDLYSLGVTFYEMFTGKLPFEAGDAMEWVHCHIAKTPAQVSNMPPIIVKIVMKLMSKNAEDRYQSAFGVKEDLEKCLGDCGSLDLKLARNDFSGQFQIPQKLYGRKKEVKTLLQAFERVSDGLGEMMLVAGYSGVGKTSLVREIHKPITKKQGYFASGKFDQFQRNIPFLAISKAFNEFCSYLLTESTEQLNKWRENILNAVGNNGQILIDIIPQLELVIGPQPAVVQVSFAEEQNRFNMIFQTFFRVICQQKHPLVLFIDDLQWADSASLNLLKSLMMEADIRYFLIIGAYRDNEVDESHPFIVTVKEIHRTEAIINFIELPNLKPSDVNLMLQESLLCETAHSQPLTDLVYQKTQGNAFFARQFLQTLYDNQLLLFDFKQHQWCWNVKQIAAQNFTDNVVSFMAGKIDKLPEQVSRILQLAACSGNQFDLQTLIIISGHEIAKTTTLQLLILQAIQEGLVVPLNENYKLVDISQVQPEHVSFKFLHDRVQQAAYSLIPEAGKPAIHIQIGRLLLKNYSEPVKLDEKLFDIVNQLNKGLSLIDTQEEQVKVAELNLRAGEKAKTSSAHQSALKYLTIAREVLPTNAFQQYYDLTFNIYKVLAKIYFIVNDFDSSEKLFQILLKSAQSTMDKVSVHAIQMEDYHLQGDYERALQIQKAGLCLLGINVSDEDDELEKLIEEELLQVPTYLGGREIIDLVNAPEMESEEYKAMLQILIGLWITAYLLSRNTIVQWSSVKMSNLCLQHGNSELASFAYIQYGFVCVNRLQKFETGYQFGEVALLVSDQYTNLDIRGKVYFMFGLVINHWKRHVKFSTESFKKGYLFSVESGDWTYAGYAAANIISNLLIAGHPCQDIYEEAQTYLDFLHNKSSEGLTHFFIPGGYCALLNLLGKTNGKNSFDCEYLNEETLHKTYNDLPIVMGWFYTVKIRSLYLFGCYEEGAQVIDQAETVAIGVPAQVKIPEAYFYSCLMLIAVDDKITDPEKKAYYWSLFDKYHAQMKIWAEHCPENYQHKYLLTEAEKSRKSGKDMGMVLSLYEQAIWSAKVHNYPNNEALAHELTAGFWLGRGNESYAKIHLTEARYGYQLWGATAKIKDLEDKYPELLAKPIPSDIASLDLESLMKASQTLSGEIILNKLLVKMMDIVIENAGAEKGFLLLPKQNRWFIEAQGHVDNSYTTVLQSLHFEKSDLVSESVIHYVTRTKETVVLRDATQDENFSSDAYIVIHRPKSLLCAPLINQGKLTAILYLENNLTIGAFTPERLEMLNLLSSQMTISIDNSLLYNHLGEKVAERTSELEQEIVVRKRAEERAKTANQAKSEFLANMSHEIRTPMNAVLGFAEILRNNETDPKKAHYIENIYSGGKALLNLINDILDLSKVEAGKLELQYSAVSIDQLLAEIKVIFNQRISKLGLDFIIEKSGDIHQALILDETRIRQILINLLGNAVKFTNAGFIKLSVSVIKDEHTLCNMVNLSFTVEDSGIGIPEDQCKKIFDPFDQAKGQKTKEYGGTGLGLAITSKLIELMNGEINVESVVGKGSSFHIELKNVEIATNEEIGEKEVTLDEKNIYFEPASILVVDDIDCNRELLDTMLNPWKFSIIEAENGVKGLAQARKYKPDLILLDMKMPEMDGYEMSEHLHKDDELKDIPVIAVTASVLKQDEQLISKICNDFLRKPVSRTDLIRKLMKYLPHTYTDKETMKKDDLQETTPKEMIFPPSDEVEKLIHSANMGSVTNMKTYIADIKAMGPQYQPFVDKIEAWMHIYEFDKIVEFVQKHIENT